MYVWRKLSHEERELLLESRKRFGYPWHSPPHQAADGIRRYIISGTCFEHSRIIGTSSERLISFEKDILSICSAHSMTIYAWCILADHYHILLRTDQLLQILDEFGKLHGRLSFVWNRQDDKRGRKVWFNCWDRLIRSHDHFWRSVNYIHHNPVHHKYVKSWQDWPYSSVQDYLEKMGRSKAEAIWRRYPALENNPDLDPVDEDKLK
jgi:REP-associated tyrosine transposase